MLELIFLIAIAWTCAKAIDDATQAVSDKHKKRIAKAGKKKGRRTGAKAAAWAATGATFAHTFAKGFVRGWKREWPKAKERAAAKYGKTAPAPEIGDGIATDGTPKAPTQTQTDRPKPEATPADSPKLRLVKDTTPDTDQNATTGDNLMALATIPEITGVNTLKFAVARFAAEANITAEEAGAMAQRAADQLVAIEAAIDQAEALDFGDDGGTLYELAAMRDYYSAALRSAQDLQQAAVDNAAVAAQSSKNIHDRHSGIQEAVAAQGGRMASKQAYTADA